MAQLRDFVPRVQAFARMCPVPIIKDEVLRALIMFSGISGVWKHRSVNDLTAGIDTYVLSVPTGAAIGWIEGVYANGSPLMPQREPWPQASQQSGPPAIYSVDQAKALRVFPVPADPVAGGLVVDVALEVAADATYVPDFFFQQHREAIVSGTLSGVLAMVGQPWADPSLALYHVKNFKSEIAKVRIATIKNSTIGRLEITSNPL